MKACSFFGHREIEVTEALIREVDKQIEYLIEEKGVKTFLFGSQSQFDELCLERVTKLREKYPDIKRVAYPLKSEYENLQEVKNGAERELRDVTKEVVCFAYEEKVKLNQYAKAEFDAFAERNEAMIFDSEYCIFYYNPDYLPPKQKRFKWSMKKYQPRSGTDLAYMFAVIRKVIGHPLEIINVWSILNQSK